MGDDDFPNSDRPAMTIDRSKESGAIFPALLGAELDGEHVILAFAADAKQHCRAGLQP